MTLDELIKSCVGSVNLCVNSHRNYYYTKTEYIDTFYSDIFAENSTEKDRLINAEDLWQLIFYLDIPFESYEVFGDSMEDVLKKASDIIMNLQNDD